jgi:hypothetical protein
LKSAGLQKMLESGKSLPAWKQKKAREIVDLINSHQVVLVTGETGSGKSTPVAQFVLDDMIQVMKDTDVISSARSLDEYLPWVLLSEWQTREILPLVKRLDMPSEAN